VINVAMAITAVTPLIIIEEENGTNTRIAIKQNAKNK
jgi:hypothetical protein